MNHSEDWFGPEELNIAARAIARAMFLLELSGALAVRPLNSRTQVAEIVVASMFLGCGGEDELVKVAVDRYLHG